MNVLVTGAAGFIGFHLVTYLIKRGDIVVGIDNINDYYDVNLKYGRLNENGICRDSIQYGVPVVSTTYNNYKFIKLDLTDKEALKNLFEQSQFHTVCNLAAQAGVRYSITNPDAYIESNIVGFLNILECCRLNRIRHLVYASSSSVYGLNEHKPFSVSDGANHPISLYAASKKSNELMAHTYSYLFNLSTTGLRFFTVYGPWGRPDMALYLFTKAILENKPIDVYNNGEMKRDFTYIDDIIDGIVKVISHPAKVDLRWDGLKPECSRSKVPYQLYNIGSGESVNLQQFVTEIENSTNLKAEKKYLPLQDGDVEETWADIRSIKQDLNYQPKFSIKEGVKYFIEWYINYYGKVAISNYDSANQAL